MHLYYENLYLKQDSSVNEVFQDETYPFSEGGGQIGDTDKIDGNCREFLFQVHQYNSNIKIVDISGIFDCYTAHTIQQKLQKLVQKSNHNLLVNLAHIEFMNIKAIRVLTGIADELRKYKREIKVCSPTGRVERLFNLIGIKKVLSVYKNEQEALKHFIKEGRLGADL